MGPPTPPDVDGTELHDGFHQLIQHNAGSEPQPGAYVVENGPYMQSKTTASYGTPEPELEGRWMVDQYGEKRLVYNVQGKLFEEVPQVSQLSVRGMQNSRIDKRKNGYGQQTLNSYHGGPYQGHLLPQQHVSGPPPRPVHAATKSSSQYYPNPAIYSATPPPTDSDQDTPPRRGTRQSRLATGAASRHNSPKPKRKAARSAKPKTLSGPLSVLTKDMDNIPIKDTENWVNRSSEVRRQEAAKDQFIKRPSNSFILYRSAYADRARSFQKSANHQVVSSLAGESWAMEPTEIRSQYDAWAKLERENHAKAFPEYKFQPQTNKASARKRKGRGDHSEDEESDLDSDYAYNPRASGRPLKSKRTKTTYRESSYDPSGTSLDDYDVPNTYHQSSHQMVNPGKPLPAALNQLGGTQYFQTTSNLSGRYAGNGYVEDMFMQPTDVSTGYHQHSAPVIGIPGAYHHELQGDSGGLSMTGLPMPDQLDPMLATYDQGHHSLAIGNGHSTPGQEMSAPQSAGFQVGPYSPALNDFEDELGGAAMGSTEWWEQNQDR